ncbi:imidazole glycerol phosphate synthase subunit HisH [Sphingomonas sp. MAH-20]|jgi:glutamine amidotransferase|uniref:Imidazole glycerol phosphate synthase subunit HisH n=1 Tax=Sphingomonas horti TaxID=2682842 RepID=A0A6I4J0B3_9SPHN|nr:MULTISPECIES: imidazole glycerol phosphate synthase subunit HisH [Sphingomonas]MBA2919761.1 imidazole glycerol phosphate synthase subunit HisH [Sphingomonas sp. CGMCC 1.13658]MVO78002.1 imidazole glycerol phosphate synthase subunit HisH [Sphingomonas horti]
MSRRTIGVVDYGVGNHASVWRALHGLGYRCRISAEPDVLSATDLLVLPGVGAFGAAMEALHRHDLDEYLKHRSRDGMPLLGLCLGMQLLADASSEHGLTAGLGLIPGNVEPLDQRRWHIGWNSIEVTKEDTLFRSSDGQSMYFNHSHVFRAPEEYQVCITRLERAFPVGVRRGNVVGLQFHPEKSQNSGRVLLSSIIEGLCR